MSDTDNTLPLAYLRDHPAGATREAHSEGLYDRHRCERIGGTKPCDVDGTRPRWMQCVRVPIVAPRTDRYWNWRLRHRLDRPTKKDRRLGVWKPTRQATRATLHRIRAAHHAGADWSGLADNTPELLYKRRGIPGGGWWD